jgi:hypothetical protein
MKKQTRRQTVFLLFCTMGFCFLAVSVPAQTKPNIVFILMDNLGYGEVGCYGGGELRGAPTPRIDKLATEGTRLTVHTKPVGNYDRTFCNSFRYSFSTLARKS